MSTPRYVSHAGSEIQTSPSGRPDAKDWSVTTPIRRDRIAARRLAMVPTRLDFSSANEESLSEDQSACHQESVHRLIGSSVHRSGLDSPCLFETDHPMARWTDDPMRGRRGMRRILLVGLIVI